MCWIWTRLAFAILHATGLCVRGPRSNCRCLGLEDDAAIDNLTWLIYLISYFMCCIFIFCLIVLYVYPILFCCFCLCCFFVQFFCIRFFLCFVLLSYCFCLPCNSIIISVFCFCLCNYVCIYWWFVCVLVCVLIIIIITDRFKKMIITIHGCFIRVF